MIKWKYLVVDIEDTSDPSNLMGELNSRGEECWELVSVSDPYRESCLSWVRVYFKKDIKDTE